MATRAKARSILFCLCSRAMRTYVLSPGVDCEETTHLMARGKKNESERSPATSCGQRLGCAIVGQLSARSRGGRSSFSHHRHVASECVKPERNGFISTRPHACIEHARGYTGRSLGVEKAGCSKRGLLAGDFMLAPFRVHILGVCHRTSSRL